MTETTIQPRWELMQGGVWQPVTEADMRAFSECIGMFSDAKGICSHVMNQMWSEIDRLRTKLSVQDV